MTEAHKYVRSLIAEFPDAGALTLAKRAFRMRPELWPNQEACRSMIRDIFGCRGDLKRKQISDKTFYREPRKSGWSPAIPEALLPMGDWKPLEIAGSVKALILSDVHIPFHDPVSLGVALQYGFDRNADLVLLNGDITDHYALSRWELDPKLRDFPAEVRATKLFLASIREGFPTARIIFKQGNHEERFERYLRLKAPDLLGLPEFEWGSVFGLDDLKIELVKDKRPIRLGQLNVIHGHEYVFSISNPVNPARGMYLRAKNHVLGGHFHQSSNHSEKTLEGKVVSAWSTGCLCGLHPVYRPLNPWNLGFAFVEVEADGAFHVQNLRIIEGKVY